jgi:hypothetical protein
MMRNMSRFRTRGGMMTLLSTMRGTATGITEVRYGKLKKKKRGTENLRMLRRGS